MRPLAVTDINDFYLSPVVNGFEDIAVKVHVKCSADAYSYKQERQ